MIQSRMSFGDHLEELRSRLIKSIIGLVVCTIVCLFFGKRVIAFIAEPLLLALKANHLTPRLYSMTLTETFMTYLRVSLYCGIFLASPWIFHQLWAFISAGLYKHERRYVQVFAPFSAILFILGGAFFIGIVAPITCNYFVRFSMNVMPPELSDSFMYKALEKTNQIDSDSTSTSENHSPPTSPDSAAPAPDSAPQNESPSAPQPLIEQMIKVQDYVSLIILLALAFSLAFQMPLVVLVLGRMNLVSIKTFRSIRKYIILAIVIVAGVITPGPDVFSQIALSLPMYILYEVGILMLSLWPRRT